MRSRRIAALVTPAVIAFALVVSGCASAGQTNQSAPPSETPAPFGSSSTSWESRARTVAEVAKESDVIIYGRVIQEPVTRMVNFESPIVDKSGTPTGATHTTTIAFADTLFEVVRSYKGNPPTQVLVMQTGGKLPSGETTQFSDDPLYRVGEEYVLFLVDISGDKIHAPDRELYRIVSPAGRFLIDGNTATTFAEEYMNQQLPNTTDELERQISEAASN